MHDADAVVHQNLRRRGRGRRSRRRFPARPRPARSTASSSRPECSTIRRRCGRSRPSSTRWCARAEARFLSAAARTAPTIAVLDIPLLLETEGDERVDAVVVVSAPSDVQRQRVLERPGDDARQARRLPGPADARRREAPARGFVVDTSRGFDAARAQVREILDAGCYNAAAAGNSFRGRRARAQGREEGTKEGAMREIVLDTETTGLDPYQGHRLIEVGCIELLNRIPSGNTFHRYVNPERDVPAEAFAIHGLSAEFLGQAAVRRGGRRADRVHRRRPAGGPQRVLRPELHQCRARARAGQAAIARDRIIDTLLLARRKHPGSPNRLDDLCVPLRHRQLAARQAWCAARCRALAEVYLELVGGRQAQLIFGGDRQRPRRWPGAAGAVVNTAAAAARSPLWRRASPRADLGPRISIFAPALASARDLG